jgi:peptidoglycan/LPS O-acetylase OafA/YrhL
LSRLLRRKPLVVLGRISYGVYIIHYPVVRVTEHWVRSSKRPIGWPESLLIASLSIGVSLLLAAISWRFLERPILSLKRAFSSVSEESHEHGG